MWLQRSGGSTPPQSRRIARALHRGGTSRGDRVDLRQLKVPFPFSSLLFLVPGAAAGPVCWDDGAVLARHYDFNNHLERQVRSHKARLRNQTTRPLKLTH